MENLRDLFFSGRFNNTFPDDLPIIGRVIENCIKSFIDNI